MLFLSSILLAINAPLILAVPGGNGIQRRTGDDGKCVAIEGPTSCLAPNTHNCAAVGNPGGVGSANPTLATQKYQHIGAKVMPFPLASIPKTVSLQALDQSTSKDKLPLPAFVSILNFPKTPSLLDKDKLIPNSTTTSVGDILTTPVTKGDKSPILTFKDKDLSVSPTPKDTKVTGFPTFKDGSMLSLLTSSPSKDIETFLKDDKSSSKDDKSTMKDDKTFGVPISSSKSFFPTITENLTSKTSSYNIYVNDKSSTLQDKASLSRVEVKPTGLSNQENTTGLLEIVYSVTVPIEHPMVSVSNKTSLLSSILQISRSNNALAHSSARIAYPANASLTLATLGTMSKVEFPGYLVVPSPTQAPTRGIQHYTISATPVYTPAMLGNAYGGGFVTTPSIYVTPRPFPNGPSNGVPPGYGSYSKPENLQSNFSLSLTPNSQTNKTINFSAPTSSKTPKDKLSGSAQSMSTSSVTYVTKEITLTTTFCPLTTVSGQVVTVSSILLTKTYSTSTVIAISGGKTQSLSQAIQNSVLHTLSLLSSKGISTPGRLSSSSGAPFSNSTLITGKPLKPTLASNAVSETVFAPSKPSEGSQDTPSSSIHGETRNTFGPSSALRGSVGFVNSLNQPLPTAPSTAALSLSKHEETLSGATIPSSGTRAESDVPKQSPTKITESTLSIFGGSAPMLSTNSASLMPELPSLLASSGVVLPTESSVAESLVSGVSSMFGSFATSTPMEVSKTALLGSEGASILTSFEGSVPTKAATIASLGDKKSSLQVSSPESPLMMSIQIASLSSELASSHILRSNTPTKATIVGSQNSESSSLLGPSTGGTSMETAAVISLSLELSSVLASSGLNNQTESTAAPPPVSKKSGLVSTFSVPAVTNTLNLPLASIAAHTSSARAASPETSKTINNASITSISSAANLTASESVFGSSISGHNGLASTLSAAQVESSTELMLGIMPSLAVSATRIIGGLSVTKPDLPAFSTVSPVTKSGPGVQSSLQDTKAPIPITSSRSFTASGSKATDSLSISEAEFETPETSEMSQLLSQASGIKITGVLGNSVATLRTIGAANSSTATESATVTQLAATTTGSLLGGSSSQESQGTGVPTFLITGTHTVLAPTLSGSSATEIQVSAADSSYAVVALSLSGGFQATPIKESARSTSQAVFTPESTGTPEVLGLQGSSSGALQVIQFLKSSGTITASELQDSNLPAPGSARAASSTGAIGSSEATASPIVVSSLAIGASPAASMPLVAPSNIVELNSENNSAASNLEAGTSSASMTAIPLGVSEAAGTLINEVETRSSRGPATLFETSEGAEASTSLSMASTLSAATMLTGAHSGLSILTVAANFSTSTAQVPSPVGPVLPNDTQASLSTGRATNGYGTGRGNFSIALSPTFVLPFLGAGIKLSISWSLGLAVLLATLFMA